MPVNKSETKFYGLKVANYVPSKPLKAKTAPRLVTHEYRSSEFMSTPETFAALRKDPKASELTAIVIGPFNESYDSDARVVVKELISAASKKVFTNLRALFVGDIMYEEQEISWIHLGNVATVLDHYPALEVLRIRGTEDFKFKCRAHDNLQTLILESGGLNKKAIKGALDAGFANLQHLELWLGSEDYGADHSVDDLMPILSGRLFPKLTHLGLRNCQYTDAIAAAIADSPILSQITSLDLSMGTLGDEGANALMSSPLFARLQSVDVSHHYMSPAVAKKLAAAGPKVVAKDRQDRDEEERYIQVAE